MSVGRRVTRGSFIHHAPFEQRGQEAAGERLPLRLEHAELPPGTM